MPYDKSRKYSPRTHHGNLCHGLPGRKYTARVQTDCERYEIHKRGKNSGKEFAKESVKGVGRKRLCLLPFAYLMTGCIDSPWQDTCFVNRAATADLHVAKGVFRARKNAKRA